MIVKELLSEWLNENHKGEIKRSTYLRYKMSIDLYINPYIGSDDIEKVTSRSLQSFINQIKEIKGNRTNKNLSSSSINTIIAVIKLAFNYAVDYEILDHNPTIRLKRIKKEIVHKDAFSKDEQIRIQNYIEKLGNPEYFPYYLVLYTGLRIGELCALEWKDINLRNGIIKVNKTKYMTKEGNNWIYITDSPKTEASIREIPIPSFLRSHLAILKKMARSKYVVSKNDGSELQPRLLRYRFSMLLKKIKVRRLNFHCLRHTFATRALENNMDIKTLSEILGHSNVTTTLNIYTHSMLEHKRKAMRRFKKVG